MKTIITANTFAASIFALCAVFSTIYAHDFTATVLCTGIACGLFVSSFIAVLFLLAERRAEIMQLIPAAIKRTTARAAHAIKRAARIAWTFALCLVVLAVSFGAFFAMVSGAVDVLSFAGIHGAARVIIMIAFLFTVAIDLTIWIELNAMALASRFGFFTDYQGNKIPFRARPVSMVGHIIRECRNA